MLAESVSSPLPALTSSPAPSVHSLPLDDKTSSDHQAESSDGKDSSDENFSRDPTYQPEFQIALTPTLTPLKNKPFANRSISTSSTSNLMKNGHKPNVCIVTRQDKNTGIPITRPHMIPQATKLKDVSRKLMSFSSHSTVAKASLGLQLRIFEWLLGYKAGTFNLDSHFNLTFSAYAITRIVLIYSSPQQCLNTGTPCLTRESGRWYPKSQLGKKSFAG
jgi:hypothetical protein